ncbi:ATP-binding protein [Planctomicrobium sp. SH668]|uniref:ATP-binding protein n=1 Tax=Planctomicrobium sp. SH668 TaxID=3448126 RepID=UPI003F5C7EE8
MHQSHYRDSQSSKLFTLNRGQFEGIRQSEDAEFNGACFGIELQTGKRVLIRSVSKAEISSAMVLRIEHEARILRTIAHPNLAQLLYFGEEYGRFWLVYEFGAGETLRDRLQRGPIPLIQSLKLVEQLLTAVDQLHQKGIVPRFLLPEDVFLLDQEAEVHAQLATVELLNPGTYRKAVRSDYDHFLKVAECIPPEQSGVIDDSFSELSNIYAIGCFLFWCLSGRTPFQATSLNELLLKQATISVPKLRELGFHVPRVIDEIIERAMNREQQSRYHSTTAMSDDIRQLIIALESGASDPDLTIGTSDYRRTLIQPSFVARSQELEQLDNVISSVKSGHAGLTYLEGESGFGKSWLTSEFATRAIQSGIDVYLGKCTNEGGQRPFEPLQEVVSKFIEECLSYPNLRKRVSGEIEEIRPILESAFPCISELFQAPIEKVESRETFGESRTLNAIVKFLESMGTQKHPAIIILDDCQWSIDLVYGILQRWHMNRSLRQSGQSFVQILVVFRSEEVLADSPLRRIFPDQSLALGVLAEKDIHRLVESMAGPLPQIILDTIVQHADGIPFMASAILSGLVECRAIQAGESGWIVNRDELAELRSSSHAAGFLSQRFNQLQPDTRRLLSVGAILGKSFDLIEAIELAELSTLNSIQAISDARSRQLVWCQYQDGICTFVHDRVREALIALMEEDERRHWHRKAAAYLKANGVEQDAELAYHFDAAAEYQLALPYALKAAKAAVSRHALDVAELQYSIASRGIEYLSDKLRYEVTRDFGEVLMLRGKYDLAEQELLKAEEWAVTPIERGETRGLRGQLNKKRGNMEEAVSDFEAALNLVGMPFPKPNSLWLYMALIFEIFSQVLHTAFPKIFLQRKNRLPDDRERLCMSLFSELSHGGWYCRSLPRAMCAHLRGMNYGETFLPTCELAQAYSDHAPAMLLLALFRRGKWYVKRSFQIRSDYGDLWGQGQSLSFDGIICYAEAEYEECIEKCRRAVQILERTGDFWQVHIARYQIAAAYLRLGDYDSALEESRRNYASGVMLGDGQASGIILDVWARAAIDRLPDSIIESELARPRPDVQGRAQVLLARAIYRMHLQDPRAAADLLETAVENIEKAGVKNPYTMPVYTWLATAWRMTAEAQPAINPRYRDYCLTQADRSLKIALRDGWRFRNDLPHLHREMALVQTMRGKDRAAKRSLKRSFYYAKKHHARTEFVLTSSVQYKIAKNGGETLPELTIDGQNIDLDSCSPLTAPLATLSLVDRFETLMYAGRSISTALTSHAICEETESATRRLIRSDQVAIYWLPRHVHHRVREVSLETLGVSDSTLCQAIEKREVVLAMPVDSNSTIELPVSTICAPILVRNEVVACLIASHRRRRNLFGDDELRIAEFLATLAGAAFENAEGFSQLERLNSTLEERVAERTATVEERAKQLASSNQELERVASELRLTQVQLVTSKQAAEEASLAKSRFLAAMSHEIRTPMNGIIGMTELALRTELDQRQKNYLSTVKNSAQSLLVILNDVLDFSKIEAGKLAIDRISFNLHDTVVEAVRLFTAMASHKSVDLNCRIYPDVPRLCQGDPNRIRQVLVNLLGNAVKFTESGEIKVTVSLESTDTDRQEIHLTVKDTGIGIPAELQERIFLPFDQGEASVTRRFGGTGLGLSISAQLIALMNGRIWVNSSPNMGSEFHVVISLGRHESRPETIFADGGDSRRRNTCLVFCENSLVLQAHEEDLSAAGIDVQGATDKDEMSGLLAVQSEIHQIPVLIDMDLHPDGTMATIHNLVSTDQLNPAQCIVLTPPGIDHVVDELVRIGIECIHEKPISLDKLASEINQLATVVEVAATEKEADVELPQLKILIVDDSSINLEVASGTFEWLGQSVTVAESGADALDFLSREEFDIVFMDIEMPGMDGITATRKYLEFAPQSDLCQASIYAMTAHVLDSLKEECRAAGMRGFVSKPIDLREIYSVLADFVETRHRSGNKRSSLENVN